MTIEEKIIRLHHDEIIAKMLEHRTENYTWSDRRHTKTPIHKLETSHIENILKAIERNWENEGLWGQNYKKRYLENELKLRKFEAQDD